MKTQITRLLLIIVLLGSYVVGHPKVPVNMLQQLGKGASTTAIALPTASTMATSTALVVVAGSRNSAVILNSSSPLIQEYNKSITLSAEAIRRIRLIQLIQSKEPKTYYHKSNNEDSNWKFYENNNNEPNWKFYNDKKYPNYFSSHSHDKSSTFTFIDNLLQRLSDLNTIFDICNYNATQAKEKESKE